jgi:predicted phage terminase large subunit-like protein
MTRWAKQDLTGRILENSIQRGGEQWEVIEFPAIMPSGKPLWPEYWSLDLLESLKAELPLAKWQAQYQQSPTSEEGALIKREWWRPWEKKDPPKVEYLIMSVDTAFLKTERADYSACTVWGVFYNDDNKSGKTMPNVILLDAWQERLEFPALKKRVYEEYKRWNPESFLVEGKAAGMPLIFELRQLGIPVEEYTPSKGNDKISRVNAVASLFSSGMVWAPSTRWAEEVVEQCAEFPSGEHDDLVDTVSQALLRYRRGGFIRSPDDYIEETNIPKRAEFY